MYFSDQRYNDFYSTYCNSNLTLVFYLGWCQDNYPPDSHPLDNNPQEDEGELKYTIQVKKHVHFPFFFTISLNMFSGLTCPGG